MQSAVKVVFVYVADVLMQFFSAIWGGPTSTSVFSSVAAPSTFEMVLLPSVTPRSTATALDRR